MTIAFIFAVLALVVTCPTMRRSEYNEEFENSAD